MRAKAIKLSLVAAFLSQASLAFASDMTPYNPSMYLRHKSGTRPPVVAPPKPAANGVQVNLVCDPEPTQAQTMCGADGPACTGAVERHAAKGKREQPKAGDLAQQVIERMRDNCRLSASDSPGLRPEVQVGVDQPEILPPVELKRRVTATFGFSDYF